MRTDTDTGSSGSDRQSGRGELMSTQRFEARGDGDDPDDCEGADRQRRSLHVPERAFGRIEQSRPAAKKTAVEIADLCFREHRDEPKRS